MEQGRTSGRLAGNACSIALEDESGGPKWEPDPKLQRQIKEGPDDVLVALGLR
jgi:hypothetical protein